MGNIFLIMFAAILTENFIFSRFLGICPFLGVSNKPSISRNDVGFQAIFSFFRRFRKLFCPCKRLGKHATIRLSGPHD